MGSLCTLIYTALGHQDLGKERMEIFYDSKSIVMEDYKVVTGYGLPHAFNRKTTHAQKGHQQLISAFFEQLQSQSPQQLHTLERLYDVAYTTLVIDKLAIGGGQATVDQAAARSTQETIKQQENYYAQ